MADDSVLVVEDTSCVFILYSAYILLHVLADDHDLPLGAVFGDTSVLGASMAAILHHSRLFLALYEHRFIV